MYWACVSSFYVGHESSQKAVSSLHYGNLQHPQVGKTIDDASPAGCAVSPWAVKTRWSEESSHCTVQKCARLLAIWYYHQFLDQPAKTMTIACIIRGFLGLTVQKHKWINPTDGTGIFIV